MSIHFQEPGWLEAPKGPERTWIALAMAWCVVLTLAMPYWHLKGKQNSTGEAYRVTPAQFMERTFRFVATNQVGELHGVPVVEPSPGGDAYLLASMWAYYPVLKLRQGQTYRLHLSSSDLQHGFSLQPDNMNFQAVPGYDHVLTITPTRAGEYSILCNEFCGIGHHSMTGRILVEPESTQ